MDTKKQFKVKRKPVPQPINLDQCQRPLTLGRLLQRSLVSPKRELISIADEFKNENSKAAKMGKTLERQQPSPQSVLRQPLTPRTPDQALLGTPDSPPPIGLRSYSNMSLAKDDDEHSIFYDQTSAPSSAGSGVTPPPFGPLLQLKVNCALCLDSSMLRLNATELQCGHFAHGSCLREARGSPGSEPPMCRYCGASCKPYPLKSVKRSSSIYSSMTLDSLAADGEDLIASHCDVEPLMIRAYAHPVESSRYELLIQVTASKGVVKSNWKTPPSAEQELIIKRMATDVIGVTQFAGQPISQQDAGKLRLVSHFKLEEDKVVAYLFTRYVIILRSSNDGFEELLCTLDLYREDAEAFFSEAGNLMLLTPEASFELRGERAIISTWVAAINDSSLVFPVVNTGSKPPTQLELPIFPGYVASRTLDFVVCLPMERVELVAPLILSQLGPQDRLGLVVVLKDGACAWLDLHKPTWAGWIEVSHLDVDACRLFTSASKDLLSTAVGLFSGHKDSGRQKSVAVVSGCPISSTSAPAGITVHTVGYGEAYDLEIMTRLARSSKNGKFYHAESMSEVYSCLAGLAASDRTYLHHDVRVKVELREGAVIYGAIGQKLNSRNSEENYLEIPLASLMSGQSRTVLLEVRADGLRPADVIGECQVLSNSALTRRFQSRQCWARVGMGQVPDVMFFDRLTRISAEILHDGLKLATENNLTALHAILGKAAANIEKAASTRPLPITTRSLQQPGDAFDLAESMAVKAKLLAVGLQELQLKVPTSPSSGCPPKLIAMLYETAHIVETQCAVTSRTGIDRAFFEILDSNRI